MSDFVVDASVAVKWFVEETESSVADELSASPHRLIAPRLIIAEVANTLSRKVIAGLMSATQARDHLRSLPFYLDSIIEIDHLIEPALEKACVIRHPIYDMIYVEAARRLDTKVITADRRLIAKLAGTDLARFATPLSEFMA